MREFDKFGTKIKTSPIEQSIDYLVECGWDREQAVNLVAAINADSAEKLWEIAPLWLDHCGESMKYINLMGSVATGLITVTQGKDGEWLFKLNEKGITEGKKLSEENT
jgi:hypothetical protein